MYSSSFDENNKDNKYIDTNVNIALKDHFGDCFINVEFFIYECEYCNEI